MNINQASSDLKTIREVMDKTSKIVRSSAPLLIMWGFIVMIGYGGAPIMRNNVGIFWSIAGPLGGFLSAIIGKKQNLKIGKIEKWLGNRIAIFWASWMIISYMLYISFIKDSAPYYNESGFFWALSTAIGFIASGLLISFEFSIAGFFIALSATLGWYLLPEYFYYIVGLLSGGFFIALGLFEMRIK